MALVEKEPQNDYLAEYDYFMKHRAAHLKAKHETKSLQDYARRKTKKEAALAWTKRGQEAWSAIQEKFTGIKLRLEPHHFYRQTMEQLRHVSMQANMISKPVHAIYWMHSHAMLYCIQNSKNRRCYSIQSTLIDWKHNIHKQLLDYFHKQNTYNSQFWFVKWPKLLKIVRIMFRYNMQFVRVDLPLRTTLYKRRDTYKKAKAKLELIDNTMAKCEFIPFCKSIQHYHTKGCSNCGVIWMGGTLQGAVPYVISYSRDTGVPTLVTLEFEKETLVKEREVQVVEVEKTRVDLAAYEDVIYKHVSLQLQRWWSFVLVYKQQSRLNRRITLSRHRFVHRRLLVLKKEIDVCIREPSVLRWQDFFSKYCDVKKAMIDYIAVQNDRKKIRIMNMTRLFYNKLMRKVEIARELKYQEWLRLQNQAPPEKPIVIKTLPPVRPGQKLVCYRPGCNLRRFITRDRYDIHMRMHSKDDVVRYAKMEHNAKMKVVREAEEQQFMSVLKEYREEIGKALGDTQALVPVCLHNNNNSHSIELYEQSTEVEESVLCLDCTPSALLSLPHRYHLTSLYSAGQYYLELVSRSVGVHAPSTIPLLPNSLTKIGQGVQSDALISFDEERLVNKAIKERVGNVHCMIFHDIEDKEDEETGKVTQESKLYILDNRTLWGTYLVSAKNAAVKVPKQGRRKESYLHVGYLLCIAVAYKGDKELSAVQASEACVVYRLQYKPNK